MPSYYKINAYVFFNSDFFFTNVLKSTFFVD